MQSAVCQLTDPAQIRALAQPVRISVLDSLREPNSAAGVARAIGQPRQKVNYHLKELESAGLVRHAGERRKGNFVEQLYQSVARRFVISPKIAWDPDNLAATLRDQVSLVQLTELGEQLQRDAAVLTDRAAFEGETITSASVQAVVRLADEGTREAFLRDYLTLLQPLLAKYGGPEGEPFRVVLAAYPDRGDET